MTDQERLLNTHGSPDNSGPEFDPEGMGELLRALPVRGPSAHTRTALRVIASRERQRRFARRDLASRLELWRDNFRLHCWEMLRSVALPVTGGVFSAVVLFSMWVVPTYTVHADSSADVPTMLTTEAAIKGMSPFVQTDGGGVAVDVTVDGQGRMVDYSIVGGPGVMPNVSLRHRLENVLLFTEFTPATSFGQPTRAKIRISFGSSRIDVKG